MDRKCASCEKDLHLVEELIMGYCTLCAQAKEKSEKGAKSRGKPKDLENVELNEQVANLVRQPRMMELMKRLKCLGEAVE